MVHWRWVEQVPPATWAVQEAAVPPAWAQQNSLAVTVEVQLIQQVMVAVVVAQLETIILTVATVVVGSPLVLAVLLAMEAVEAVAAQAATDQIPPLPTVAPVVMNTIQQQQAEQAAAAEIMPPLGQVGLVQTEVVVAGGVVYPS
jgi:hypothetical protein